MFEPLYKSIREIIRSFYKEVLNLEYLHLKSQTNKKILHKGNTIYGLSNKTSFLTTRCCQLLILNSVTMGKKVSVLSQHCKRSKA